MNWRIVTIAALLAALAFGCRKSEAEGEHHDEEAAASETHAERPANILEIERDDAARSPAHHDESRTTPRR